MIAYGSGRLRCRYTVAPDKKTAGSAGRLECARAKDQHTDEADGDPSLSARARARRLGRDDEFRHEREIKNRTIRGKIGNSRARTLLALEKLLKVKSRERNKNSVVRKRRNDSREPHFRWVPLSLFERRERRKNIRMIVRKRGAFF